jgi:RNase adapter protein RapZ
MKIFVITGTSGSGKSVAIRALEDAGYDCVDNLPVHLLESLIQGVTPNNNPNLAVAIDGRQGFSIQGLPTIITKLKTQHEISVLFLDASTEALVHRFSETRRRHPLSSKTTEHSENSLIEAINLERELLIDLGSIGHHIDTSNLSTSTLKDWVKDLTQSDTQGLTLLFESFGYKNGIPQDVDIMFDMRCIPNPYYDKSLRHLTGNDAPVLEYLRAQSLFGHLKTDVFKFIETWVPKYQVDGRSYLTIGIGCTGGQHRSIAMVNELFDLCSHSSSAMFKNLTLLKRHRELHRILSTKN